MAPTNRPNHESARSRPGGILAQARPLRLISAALIALVAIGPGVATGQVPFPLPPIPTPPSVPVTAARVPIPTLPASSPVTPASFAIPAGVPIFTPPAGLPTLRSTADGAMPAEAQVVQPSAPPQPMQPAPAPPPGTGTPPVKPPDAPPNPYGGPLSNPLLSPAPPTLGTTPVPTQATRDKVNKNIARLLDPEATLDLIAGQTRVLVLKNTPFRVQAGDERIVGLTLVNPREVLIQGKVVGATVFNIWFGDRDDPTKQEILSYLVRVYPDPEAKERLEKAYRKLQDEINGYFKDTSIQLKLVGDKMVVSGRVRDYIQGQQILQIIRANMSSTGGAGGAGQGPNALNAGGTAGQIPLQTPGVDPTTGVGPPSLENFQSAGGPNVINLLEVAGEQQVSLRVVVAEVNRAAARSIGMNFSVRNNQGITVFSNNTGPIISSANGSSGVGTGVGTTGSGVLGSGSGIGSSFLSGGAIGNLSAIFDSGKVPFAINALRTMQYARSLTDQTLVTMNGQPSYFQAGGQFPVPVVGGYTLTGLQGVQYVPFGVLLNYTPFITDRDRIRLILNTTVSARDVNTGTTIGTSSVSGLTTRNVSTTVELRHGETLAVAGLIESNQGANSTRIPFLGTLPVVGPLTGLTQHQSGEKELVILITPELTRPMDAEQLIKLPGYEILDPNDLEFYIWGRIEGHCKDYRSPIRTDLSRIRMYQQMEQANVAGPSGYTPPTTTP